MWTIGLTGGIGSGKSSVARWWAEQGIPVIDADHIVHQLLAGDKTITGLIAARFGTEMLVPEGHVDRQALGKLVFDDRQARLDLEGIVHPAVICRMEEKRAQLGAEGFEVCIWDVPLLMEAGMEKLVDEVWLVWTPLEVQIGRVRQRDKLDRKEVLRRINAQIPLDKKREQAHIVIDNSGSWQDTEGQLLLLQERIRKIIP